MWGIKKTIYDRQNNIIKSAIQKYLARIAMDEAVHGDGSETTSILDYFYGLFSIQYTQNHRQYF